ncbi:MAG: Inorganic pyrophosphatase [Anaerorhabdus sp.]
MKEFENNAFFWQKVDTLIFSNHLELLYHKGDKHDQHPQLSYPVDYGSLRESQQSEESLYVFKGSQKASGCNAMVVTADILKKEIEVKLLLDCTEEEEKRILEFLNKTDLQKAVLMRRGDEIPEWALTD